MKYLPHNRLGALICRCCMLWNFSAATIYRYIGIYRNTQSAYCIAIRFSSYRYENSKNIHISPRKAIRNNDIKVNKTNRCLEKINVLRKTSILKSLVYGVALLHGSPQDLLLRVILLYLRWSLCKYDKKTQLIT